MLPESKTASAARPSASAQHAGHTGGCSSPGTVTRGVPWLGRRPGSALDAPAPRHSSARAGRGRARNPRAARPRSRPEEAASPRGGGRATPPATAGLAGARRVCLAGRWRPRASAGEAARPWSARPRLTRPRPRTRAAMGLAWLLALALLASAAGAEVVADASQGKSWRLALATRGAREAPDGWARREAGSADAPGFPAEGAFLPACVCRLRTLSRDPRPRQARGREVGWSRPCSRPLGDFSTWAVELRPLECRRCPHACADQSWTARGTPQEGVPKTEVSGPSFRLPRDTLREATCLSVDLERISPSIGPGGCNCET